MTNARSTRCDSGWKRLLHLAAPLSALFFFCFGLLQAPRAQSEERVPLAEMDGEPIYVDEVEGALAFRIYQLEVDKYALLKSEAERRIEARLLSEAAKKRGLSVETLLAEIEGGKAAVSAADIDAYLADHPARAEADPAKVKERVRNYLSERGRHERRVTYLEGLRKAAGARVLLQPPERPRTEFDLEDAPSRGPEDAAVQIIHFASFGSRNSARSAAKIARLAEAFPGKIRHSHINLLADRDEAGLYAARVGFAARDAGQFWAVHDAFFEAEGRLRPKQIKAIAEKAGLGSGVAAKAAASAERLGQAKAEIARAVAAGVPREPGLFINGLFISGLLPFEDIQALVEEELQLGESRSN
ncbi:MAG: DsbA family protein [Myxococcota bacterium]